MRQKLSGQELHALYCPVKNTKSALFLVVSFAVVAFVGWKGLHKPLAPPSFVELIFAILLVAAMLATLLVPFTCFRERLLLGLFIVSLVTGEVVRFVPSLMGKHAEMIKSGKLALSLLGLIVSLSMLVQSVAKSTCQAKRFAAIVIVLFSKEFCRQAAIRMMGIISLP